VVSSAEPWLAETDHERRMEEFHGADDHGWSLFELRDPNPPEHYLAGFFANRRGKSPALAGYIIFDEADLLADGIELKPTPARFDRPEDVRLAHWDAHGLVASGRAEHLLALVAGGERQLVEVDRVDLIRRQVGFVANEADDSAQGSEIKRRVRQLADGDPGAFERLVATTDVDVRSWLRPAGK